MKRKNLFAFLILTGSAVQFTAQTSSEPVVMTINGKSITKAEFEAAQKLPRQVSNFGKFSSLLRFAYYFTDYLLGQFYIYLNYTLRGTVVLYDRYYFDFILDSRRSNINNPEILLRVG